MYYNEPTTHEAFDRAYESRNIPWYEITDRRCAPSLWYQEYEARSRRWGRQTKLRKEGHFEAAMISTFPGVFDDCDSNYEVEDRLRKAGVIHKRNQTDTESCALVIRFTSEKSAFAFAKRLQAYIQEHEKKEVSV